MSDPKHRAPIGADRTIELLPRSLLQGRRSIAFLVQAGLLAAAYVLAFMVRFDFRVPEAYARTLWLSLPGALAVKLVVFTMFRLHQGWWRYAGLRDLETLVKASAIAAVGAMTINYMALEMRTVPRSIYLLDPLLSVILVGGMRLAVRMFRERLMASRHPQGPAIRVLIVGTGDAAEALLRGFGRPSGTRYKAVGLLDDDDTRHGLRIHGVPVLGGTDRIGAEVQKGNVQEVVFAQASLTRVDMQRIVARCEGRGVRFRVLPKDSGSLVDHRMMQALRDVQLEDLLGRAPVPLESESVRDLVQGKVVLVSGAGGSIGSELVRQVARHHPARLILLERAENALFLLTEELTEKEPGLSWEPVVGDVTDEPLLNAVFARSRPHVVVHAAAHKHVPMMEHNASEAVRNNVFGTLSLARAAARHRADTFVLISTDKAVNPTSVMGTTKRVAELVVQGMASAHPETRFVAVRFGNVLGSNGSVVPTFKQQIARGGPVTVTHPDMRRYFMTIPEASQLVLTAAALGQGGEVFILDMDEPVRIVDMARNLIRLAGLRPDEDVKIVYTGLRPGEKLFEELSVEGEGTRKTRHEKIFMGKVASLPTDVLAEGLQALRQAADDHQERAVRECLEVLVAEARLSPAPARADEPLLPAVVAGPAKVSRSHH